MAGLALTALAHGGKDDQREERAERHRGADNFK
jgi:hypothetical protein